MPSSILLLVTGLTLCRTAALARGESGSNTTQQTQWQRALFKNVSEAAAALSRVAEPALLEKLDSAPFRAELAACCPSVSTLSSKALLQRLQDEVDVVEVASGFDAVAPRGDIQPDAPGMSIADGLSGSFFQNVWQDVLLHNQTFTQSVREIWKANFSLDGQTVQWQEWSQSQEGCIGKALYTVAYPLGLCVKDPSQGSIVRYSRNGRLVVKVESWSSEMQSWKSKVLWRRLPSKNARLTRPSYGNVPCPSHQPDWTMNYTADGACHGMTLWNASTMWDVEDNAEIHSYGLKPFAVLGAPRSFAEASERGPYALVNSLLFDQGSPLFGDVSVVFSANTMRETAVISAIDTGTYQISCTDSSTGSLFGMSVNCSAYEPFRQLGTFKNFNHLFLVNDAFWNGTQALAHRFARLEGSWGSRAVPSQSLLRYWEALPAATLQYPSDVRFLIGSFRSLFGSESGRELQKWAKQRGWVLVWSLGLNVQKSDINSIEWIVSSNRSFRSNQRLVDPEALLHTSAAKGLPLPKDAVGNFGIRWGRVEALRKTGSTVTSATWLNLWDELVNNQTRALQIGPLRAGLCSRPSTAPECVGITLTGECVCYSPSESSTDAVSFV
jgi:hypothetical protein